MALIAGELWPGRRTEGRGFGMEICACFEVLGESGDFAIGLVMVWTFSDDLRTAWAVLGLIGDLIAVVEEGLSGDFLSQVRALAAVGDGTGVLPVLITVGDLDERLPEKLSAARKVLKRPSDFFPSLGLAVVGDFDIELTNSMCIGSSMEELGDDAAVVGEGKNDNAVVGVISSLKSFMWFVDNFRLSLVKRCRPFLSSVPNSCLELLTTDVGGFKFVDSSLSAFG